MFLEVHQNTIFIFTSPFIIILIVALVARKKRMERQQQQDILDAFRSRNDLNNSDDLYWYTAREVVGRLGFTDCVIYKVDHEKKICEQVSASGPKSPAGNKIMNPIVIHFGKGIVGSVAVSGKAELIGNTTNDPRYVPDDDVRYSEVTVPVLKKGKVVVVIDSEEKRVDQFKKKHLAMLLSVAEIMSSKISD